MSNFLNLALGQALLSRGMGATDVIFVRHGQQERPGEGAPESDAYDAPLSALGRQQAQAAAQALAKAPVEAVFASDLRRAHDTGAAIAALHDLPVIADAQLREVGLFQDVPEGQSIREAIGDDAARSAAEQLVRTMKWDAAPLSETSADFRARVHAAVWQIVRDYSADRDPVPTGQHGPTIVIACHGGVINAFLAEEYGLQADFFFRPVHAGITRVRFDLAGPLDSGDGRAVMVSGNEHAHLEAAGLVTY